MEACAYAACWDLIQSRPRDGRYGPPPIDSSFRANWLFATFNFKELRISGQFWQSYVADDRLDHAGWHGLDRTSSREQHLTVFIDNKAPTSNASATLYPGETASGTKDRILLTGLAFYGYHGVMPEEGRLGQRFRLDLALTLDLDEAARTDRVEATISYADLHEAIQRAFEEKRFKLIEALALHMIARLFETHPPLERIFIRVRKPEAPLPIIAGEAAVELERGRAAMALYSAWPTIHGAS